MAIERVPLISRVPKNEFWITDEQQIRDLFGDKNIHLMVNPAVETHLTVMTDQETDIDPYRHSARCASDTLFSEASHLFPTRPKAADTLWGPVPGVEFQANPLFVSILRGARPLELCIEKLYPNAPIVPISASRDPHDPWQAHITTQNPKFPPPDNWHIAMVDMTCATGGTFRAAGNALRDFRLISSDYSQVTNLSLISVFTSVPGLQRIFQDFPYIHVYTSRIIFNLDERCYMIGGPGDAGLRCSYDLATIRRMRVH